MTNTRSQQPHQHPTVTGRFSRWLYHGHRPNFLARSINAMCARAWATGRGPAGRATLEVVGRRSGKPVRLPVVIAYQGGERYLVSMLGEGANWVCNVRADGNRAVLISGDRAPVHREEVPVAQRAPIIKRYCQVATSGRVHIPVGPAGPLVAFEAISAQYPVFRIVPRLKRWAPHPLGTIDSRRSVLGSSSSAPAEIVAATDPGSPGGPGGGPAVGELVGTFVFVNRVAPCDRSRPLPRPQRSIGSRPAQ